MTRFDTDGFLSSEIGQFEKDIESKFTSKFSLAEEVNRLVHDLIYRIEIHNQHLPDLLIASLFTRQAASFQAFLILLKKGLQSQSEILLRNIAETMFIAGAIGKDKSFADKYVLSEDVSRKKALTRLKNNWEKNGKEVDKSTSDLILKLNKKIQSENIRHFTTEQIASLAGLSDYYDTLYPLMSLAVHTSSRGLDKFLQTNDQGEVYALDYGPTYEKLDMYLDYGMSMMLHTANEASIQFEKDATAIDELQKRNEELAGAV